MSDRMICVYNAEGALAGKMIENFLKSLGMDAISYQESAGQTLGLTVGRLGEAKVYVPEEQEQQARDALIGLKEGKFELSEDSGNLTFEDTEED